MSGAETSGPRDPAGRPDASKKVSDLPKRLMSALVLGALAILVTWCGGLSFALLWALAGAGFAFEWFGLIAPRNAFGKLSDDINATEKQPAALGVLRLMIAVGIGALSVLIELEVSSLAIFGTAIATLVVCAVWAFIVRKHSSNINDNQWQKTFGKLIIAWILAGLVLSGTVGVVPVYARAMPEIGAVLIAWMFAVVWTTDIAAYFSGRAIGGPKLWPQVSPNKTWSGAIGGTLAGTLMGGLVAMLAAGAGLIIPWSVVIVLMASLLASIAGQAGDLAELALKRRAGVKDSGSLIPGHGGVMDRLDGFVIVSLLVGIGFALGV